MELSISEKKKAKKVRKRENLTFSILNYTFFFLITLICAYPFYYLIINSISNNELSALGQIRFFPQEIHFENYSQVLQLKGLPLAATVSVARTVIGTAATVLASAFLGFMFTQEKMWKRKFWYRFVVITMYFNAGLIPLFITMKTLGLTNNFWVYILPAVVQPFNIILVKTYIESIPKSLQEAAEMDGAGIIQVFFRVILPNCTPILATVAIFSAIGSMEFLPGYTDLHYGSKSLLLAIPSLYVYQSSQFVGTNGQKYLGITFQHRFSSNNADADVDPHDRFSHCCFTNHVHLSAIPEVFCQRNYVGCGERLIKRKREENEKNVEICSNRFVKHDIAR